MRRIIFIFLTTCVPLSSCVTAQTDNKPTFHTLLTLLQQIQENEELPPKAIADAAGLTLLNYSYYDGDYSNNDDGNVYPDEISIVYGRNANYLECERDTNGISKFEKIRKHACVLEFSACTDTGAGIYFSDEEDYKSFMTEALDYGLLQIQGGEPNVFYVTGKPIKNGGIHSISEDDLWGEKSDERVSSPLYQLTPQGKNQQGWYEYAIWIGF